MKLNKLILLSIPALLVTACGNNSKPAHVHKYSDVTWTWEKSASTYEVTASYTCLDCNESFNEEAVVNVDITKEATCLEAGSKTYTAVIELDNGEERTDSKVETIPQKGHQPKNNWVQSEEGHYRLCEYCDTHLDEDVHDYNDWTVVKEAELGVEGLKSRECKVCSYVDEEVIPAIYATVEEVQDMVDKSNASKLPYNYELALKASNMYKYLKESDKETISNYSKVLADIEYYEDAYECPSPVSSREVRKRDSEHLNYAGTWEGNTSKGKDDSYGDVDILDIQTVGTGWGEGHFNGISFEQDSTDCSKYNFIEFAIYNPSSGNANALLYTDGWYRVPDEATTIKLKPGWNELSFAVKNGAYNGTNGYTNITLDDFSIILMDNQVNDGWKITSIFGKKTSSAEVNYVISLINALPLPSEVQESDKDAIEAARVAYDALGDDGKAKVTNYQTLLDVESAYSTFVANEVVELINTFPSTFDLFETFAVLDAVEVKYASLSESAKQAVSNYSIYQSNKTYFEERYEVIYNPRTAMKLSHEGTSNCDDELSITATEYGPSLKIDATCTGGTYQTWTYGFPTASYSNASTLNFKIYSPFEAVDETSQTFWAGDYGTAQKISLTPEGWTTISETGDSLNSNGAFSTYINESKASFLNLQRYDGGNHLSNLYSGTYYLTAIIASK